MVRFPETSVFLRRLDRDLPVAVAAEGSWIVGGDGRRWLDASGGAVVANLGHDLDDVAEAVAEQIRTLGYVNGTQFTTGVAEQLAAELTRRLPDDLAYVYFLSSGSEAIEAAIKLARQYHVERGEGERSRLIARVPSYHGNTLAALALSGREHYRALYAPWLIEVARVPAPDPLRRPAGPGTTGEAVEAEILRLGPGRVAALVAEPVGGSSAGAVVPPPEHWPRVVEACRRQGVLWIADEVLCGLGRTGRWFAFERFGVVPDILVLGKGLNAGALPLSAVVARREIVETIAAGRGAFVHAQTYSHHPAACAAGLATLRRLERDRLVERAAALEPALLAALAPLAEHPAVGDLRGVGLLAAVELVADRRTLAPFPRSERMAERLAEAAFDEGLVVWPNAGNVDGVVGDLVVIAPPFTVTEAELGEIGARLARALRRVRPA